MNSSTIIKIQGRLALLSPEVSDSDFLGFRTKAAVSLILRQTLSGPEILFIHRSKRSGDPWSGHIAFPGGRTEKSDNSPQETAKRETKEEVGLDLSSALYLGRLARMQLKKLGSPIDYGLECHVFFLETQFEFTLDPREVSEAFWVNQNELFGPESIKLRDFHFSGISKELPCIEIKGKVIWGITYMLLSHFEKVINEIEGMKQTRLPPYPVGPKS